MTKLLLNKGSLGCILVLLLVFGCEKNGKYFSYHHNGQIWYEANYKDGKQDGKSKIYLSNGQLSIEMNYKDGKKDGKWTYYNLEDGTIKEVVNWKDGKLID